MDRFRDLVESQIQDAIARGEFDDLPGTGRPLDLGEDDTGWWAKRKIQEMAEEDRLVELASELQSRIDQLWTLPDESRLLAHAGELDELIAALNETLPESSRLPRLSREETLRIWRNMFRLRISR
ncbi:MAG TPA: DnaJ family domain-containing protein [Acidimicrobiia bacterium]|jgi:hypothetical protein|nr:DnaJ family domain-containing protein [Acidimicrobiia bacterium]